MSSHLDGMSSDDERPDQDIAQYKTNLGMTFLTNFVKKKKKKKCGVIF